MANAPHSSPRSRVSRAAASRAVESLLKWIKAQRNPNNIAATGHDEFIFLILTLTKTPHKFQSKPYRIPLLHPLHDRSTVSLIIDDRHISFLTISAARDLIRSHSLPISQILSLSDLRSGILPVGELLFADRRIARLLGSFKKKGEKKKSERSMPVEIDFSRKEWPEYVRRVCFSTVLNLGSGTCSGIRVGRASQGIDEIVDNLMVAMDGAVRNVPRKWSNVMGFHLKTSESLALPIYEKSNWPNAKVADNDDDEDINEEERMENEKHRKIERRALGATWKRARDGNELDGGEVRKIKRKT